MKEKREAGGTGGAPGREGEGIEITLRVPAATLSKLRRTVTALFAGAVIGSGATLGALRAETPPPDPSPPPAMSDPADSPRVCGSAQCACPD